MLLEGRGFNFGLYSMQLLGEAVTAGKATNKTIWLSSDLVGLKQFLTPDSLYVLLYLGAPTASL
ncbi:hypothetical protein BGX24_011834 [Mortierella sp. AD032]|nr:hypothetical protein BGX24_011834 [Mortierella sp. AD032]